MKELTYLLFLKMTHARSQPPHNHPTKHRARHALRLIFAKIQSSPRRVVADLIDIDTRTILGIDVKGDAH